MGRLKPKDVTYKIQFRKYDRQSTDWSSISSILIDLSSVKGRRDKVGIAYICVCAPPQSTVPSETQKEVLDPLALGF